MSTKTPSLQTRSQYNRDWGNYASLAALPNGSGNALANPYFSQLEVGDTAYITGTTQKAVCTAVGSLSGANATWVAIGSGGGGDTQTTQTVTSSPAVVSAKLVVLDDDTHTSGAPGSLVMPPITEGAWHVIATPYEDVHYLVVKDPGDPVNTGPDLVVDSSYVRQQTIVLFAAESDGILRWQYDATGYYVTQILTAYLATAAQVLALEEPYALARTHTETTAAYTWSSGLTIKRLVINRNASKPAITLDESDWEDGTTCRLDVLDSGGFGVQIIVGGGAVLNGQTAGLGYATLPGSTNGFDGMPPSYEVTRIDGGWTIRSMVDVADGVVDAFIDMSGRVDALEAIATTVVTGPASSTNNAVARFDGATGKLVQNSVVTLSDGGSFAGVASLTMTDEIIGPTRMTLDVNGDILLGAGKVTTKYLGAAAFAACFHSGSTTPNVGIGSLGEVSLESNSNAAVYLDINEHVPEGAEISAIYVFVNPGDPRAGVNRMRVDRHTRTVAIGSPPTIGANSIVSTYDDTTTNTQQIAMTGLALVVNKAGGVLRHITVHSGNTAGTNPDKVYGAAIVFTQYEITGR